MCPRTPANGRRLVALLGCESLPLPLCDKGCRHRVVNARVFLLAVGRLSVPSRARCVHCCSPVRALPPSLWGCACAVVGSALARSSAGVVARLVVYAWVCRRRVCRHGHGVGAGWCLAVSPAGILPGPAAPCVVACRAWGRRTEIHQVCTGKREVWGGRHRATTP